jgi:hypothetical protein
MMVHKGGGYPFEVVKGLIRSKVKDGAPSHAPRCMVMVLSGAYRVLREGRNFCLPNLGWSLLTTGENPEKGPRDGLYVPTLWGEEEELGHVLRACPELESPRRRNLVLVPSRSRP